MKIIRPMVVVDASLLATNVLENDYPSWDNTATYALGDRVIVVGVNTHEVYESLQAANLNHIPASSPTWWLNVSKTNRWKMFDQLVGSQTARADEIDVTVVADGRADSVTLLNISASTVRVIATDDVDGIIYDKTVSTTYNSGITDWYAYFYEPITRATDMFFGDLLPYTNAKIRVLLDDLGATVKCGACIIGLSKEVGGTQYGAKVGIQDYSIKTVDVFGNYTILQRAFANRASFTLRVAAGYVDTLKKMLADVRAVPTVFIGSDLYGSTIVYGFYKDFDIDIAYRDFSVCTIELEGLT